MGSKGMLAGNVKPQGPQSSRWNEITTKIAEQL